MGNNTLPPAPQQFADVTEMQETMQQWFHAWIATKEYKELEPPALQQHMALQQWLQQCIACCKFE